METKKIAPLIPEDIEAVENGGALLTKGKEREERIHGKIIKNVTAEEEDFSHLLLSAVKLVNCRFWNCSFQGAEFRDVIFKACDLSGCDMNDTYFDRVEMTACKGIGTKFAGCNMNHLVITECNLNYANFDASKLEHITVRQTELNSSNLAQCKCKHVLWEKVRLVNASFFKTSLRDMDFSDSTITGLVLSEDSTELEGAVVDVCQAVELSKRLGIIIKDTQREEEGI